MRKRTIVALLALGWSGAASAAPVFLLSDAGGVGPGTRARAGFEAAAAVWSSIFADDVVIRLDVGFTSLGSGILGQAGSARSDVSYDRVRSALGADRRSAADRQTYDGLLVRSDLRFVSNEAGNCSTGVGCRDIAPAYRAIDRDGTRDNTHLAVNTSVQKALELRGDTGSADASITFNSSFRWDYDGANGIASGYYDFVGVAAHELGHALGFVSGADLVDQSVGDRGLDAIAWGSVLDLFRFNDSTNLRDWGVGGTPCLSLDRGATCLGSLSSGVRYGDGRQASHWRDSRGLGIMDPTAATGETLRVSSRDRTAFDIIGWDLAAAGAQDGAVRWTSLRHGFDPTVDWDVEIIPADVPAPGVVWLLGLGLAALGVGRVRHQR